MIKKATKAVSSVANDAVDTVSDAVKDAIKASSKIVNKVGDSIVSVANDIKDFAQDDGLKILNDVKNVLATFVAVDQDVGERCLVFAQCKTGMLCIAFTCVPNIAYMGGYMVASLTSCAVTSTKTLASSIKTLFNKGSSLSLDDAATFLKTQTNPLKCLVQRSTTIYDGYFDAIAVSIEGAASTGASMSYTFGFSLDNTGDAVVFYSSCKGISVSAGIDGALGLAFQTSNPDNNEVEYEANVGFDVGIDVSMGYGFDFS